MFWMEDSGTGASLLDDFEGRFLKLQCSSNVVMSLAPQLPYLILAEKTAPSPGNNEQDNSVRLQVLGPSGETTKRPCLGDW